MNLIEYSPPYFKKSFGILSIPQAFPDLRLSRTDLMFPRWVLSDKRVSEVIRFWSIFLSKIFNLTLKNVIFGYYSVFTN
jgi:hypothetical protein